jgi:hypothetical protein
MMPFFTHVGIKDYLLSPIYDNFQGKFKSKCRNRSGCVENALISEKMFDFFRYFVMILPCTDSLILSWWRGQAL